MNSRKFTLFLTLLLIAAGGVRAFRRNWDDNTHLHPDERYLTMVSSALQFPSSLKEYWDTESSPLNPMNSPQYGNYVYGTLPPFVTRAAGAWLDRACGPQPSATAQAVRGLFLGTTRPCPQGMYTGYGGIHLVGRTLSTLADLAALLALVLLARTLYGEQIALLAGALYGFAVLPIQHAHFFVVDSFATVFVMWALCFIVWAVHKRQWGWLLLAGLSTGLAVACKISVWPLAGMVGLAGILQRDEQGTYHFTLAAPQVGASQPPACWLSWPSAWRNLIRSAGRASLACGSIPTGCRTCATFGIWSTARRIRRPAISGQIARRSSSPGAIWCSGGWACRWD